MIFRVRHVTTYSYAEPVLVAHHMAHLTPRSFESQRCKRTGLRVTPTPSLLNEEGVDYFGNPVTFFTLQDPHRKLTIEAVSKVEVLPRDLPAPGETPEWESVAAMLRCEAGPNVLEAAEYTFESPFVRWSDPAIKKYAQKSFPPERPILAGLLDLTHRVFKDFKYDPAATTLATPLSQVMAEKRGVCQDFAHLMLACLRSLGLPARYVSGYLLTRPPPGKEKLRGSDASHAWVSAWVPGAGWIDLDPTNDCIPGVEHVTTAWGRDYEDVSPIRGVVLGGGDHSLRVAVDVEPLEI